MKSQLIAIVAAVLLVGCGGAKYSSALFNAVNKGNIEAVELLIAKGVDVDAKDDRFIGQTPLHRAAWKSYKEIVELLIAAGADVNAKDIIGLTPLHAAARSGYDEAHLTREARRILPTGRKEIAELLIAKGADMNAKLNNGWAPLHDAAMLGHKEVVELLIAKGADVNAKAVDGETPLDRATGKTADLLRKHGGKHGTILSATGGGDIEAVKEFLAAGVDVNAKNDWGETPLHRAAVKGRKEMAELLIAKGADVNAKDNKGRTPLDFANVGYEGEPPEDKAAKKELADLLRVIGGKTGEELKAEGK
jgi:cytohesin